LKNQNRAIVMRLPEAVVERLDVAANALRMSRSAYMRRAVVRGLQFSEDKEMPLLESAAIRRALTP
jgi:predicted transcriptional regulator